MTPAPAPAPVPPAPPPYRPPDGFSTFKIEDGVPLCLFPNDQVWWEAKLLGDVGKQRLKAKAKVVIGAFGAWCVNEHCDQKPSLQCSVEREGDTLIVHSRFWGEHKDGSVCTQECKSITASCTTPELEAGTYTVKHGEDSFTFELPTVLTNPCFGAERPPPAAPAVPAAPGVPAAPAAPPPTPAPG